MRTLNDRASRPRLFVSACCLVAVLGAGCSRQSVNAVSRREPTAQPAYVGSKVEITDRGLHKRLRVLSVNESVVSGDLAKVQVRVQNLRSRPQQLSYKFEWQDGDGMVIDSPTQIWRSTRIQGGDAVSLVSVAPRPGASDFRLKLQESRH